MFAVIKTGGKQYRVKEGDVLSIEKLEALPGAVVTFDQVLLIEDEGRILVGNPYVEKATVTGEVIETYKDDKITVFKKKRRKGYRRTKGHRQLLTKVKIAVIYPEGSGMTAAEPAESQVEKPAEEKAKPRVRKSQVKEPSSAREKAPVKKTPRTTKKTENKEENKEN
ncbi:MAG TPA: 50S ribosomal protein L21 [Candidatus Saccharicenans sp.]|jgi:large subunit ribosomal protein L21|nr:50S ribosomal protein L21 [Candidatus Saccharicenans sp.]HRD02821.1 50S ribosomal protein L21 [Candidatus Saccharicenans sp.]